MKEFFQIVSVFFVLIMMVLVVIYGDKNIAQNWNFLLYISGIAISGLIFAVLSLG